MEDLRDSLAELSGRKAQLLEDAGFAPDYLEPVYECPDCQDTGYIGSKPALCLTAAFQLLYLILMKDRIVLRVCQGHFMLLIMLYLRQTDIVSSMPTGSLPAGTNPAYTA